MVFSDIVDAADTLTPEEQLALVEILQRRLAEQNRQSIIQDVAEAREDFSEGNCESVTVKEIMDRIQP